MGHKRKRQSDANTTETAEGSSSKVRVVEDTSGKPTAQAQGKDKSKKAKTEKKNRAQIRSERKAKRIAVAHENALRNQRVAAEEYAAAVNAQAADGIAGGEDFIPLTTEAALEILQKEKRQEEEERKSAKLKRYENGKPHRASPRSMRKAAKAAKALALATEEYGPDIIRDSGNASNIKNNDAHSSKPKTAPRFIVFVGNLPFSCTTEQLQSHFIKLNPKSIRHPTEKETGKSKGFAFLEFHEYDKMKTCLKLYHHTLFEPDRTAQLQREAGEYASELLPRIGDKKNKGRMINVELTVGGGGKTDQRRKKLAEKNIKLETKRAKARLKAMKKEKLEAKKARKLAAGEEGEPNEAAILGTQDVRGDVHPSRLSRVKA